MKILSFDVGVTSLSMIIFTVPEKDRVNPKLSRSSKKTSSKQNVTPLDAPIYNFDIQYWECIDLAKENCAYQTCNKKGQHTVITSKEIDLPEKNYFVIESLIRRQPLWDDFTGSDYILIENQLLEMKQGVKMGSVDNKVLSYAIRNFFYMYFLSRSNTETIPDVDAVSRTRSLSKPTMCATQNDSTTFSLAQRGRMCIIPTIDFVNPSLKLKQALLQKFCGDAIALIATTNVHETRKKKSNNTTRTSARKTKKQKFIAASSANYKFRKNLSVGYTEQILKLANEVSVHKTPQTLVCTLFGKKKSTKTASASKTGTKTVSASKTEKVLSRTSPTVTVSKTPVYQKHTLTHWCTLYNDFIPGERKSNQTSPGWKFHHTVIPKADGKQENKNRRSDLGDCFLQAVGYYILKIAKFKFPKAVTKLKSKNINSVNTKVNNQVAAPDNDNDDHVSLDDEHVNVDDDENFDEDADDDS